ncbi:MAG: hypothetical protein QOI35_1086, partial [Cryptosporangiaceae bacterium]|nr:hypothetical protein [Cryptosporangiaceae bacterium]
SAAIMDAGMTDPVDPVFLATYGVTAEALAARGHAVQGEGRGRILRSVLMKPESEEYVGRLHSRVEELSRKVVLPGDPGVAAPV